MPAVLETRRGRYFGNPERKKRRDVMTFQNILFVSHVHDFDSVIEFVEEVNSVQC